MAQCPTCLRRLSADLLIYSDLKGFAKVHLGMQCKTCKTLYKTGEQFWAVLRRVEAYEKGATVA